MLNSKLTRGDLPHRQAAARALAEVARSSPASLSGRWRTVVASVAEPHTDKVSSNDCGSHSDTGIGLYFPALPPGDDF